ncbi:MAG TPA: multidrug efflux RND transporter permease subunit [Candidatus Melainabacteria bacterium]|nr:multidrug efflux RND transporter permease subunit [Candidatus Melainabacteria bacterium]
MFVNFFISRPIFASVCSLVIVIAGLVSIPNLPIAQFPDIVPPQIKVTSAYTGASASAVEASVTNILEQQINGVRGMKYLTSSSGNDGTSTINVTFDLERDVDAAAVDVQNRVGSVQGRLPDEVKKTGVTVDKVSTTIIFAAALSSDRHDALYLSNYADLYIKDALKRVKGVGDVTIFGERKYSMRIWLDPTKLNNRKITTADVTRALQNQNVQVASGSIGKAPYPKGQSFEISTRVVGRLRTPEEFGNIVIKAGPFGSVVKIKDVGRVELGAENYGTFLRYKGKNAVGIAIYQFPGANALDVARDAKVVLNKLTENLPPGIQCEIAFDTTRAVEESIHEVVKTLGEAIFLVILVIFLFLQSWRTTIIPAITIPVSLIGTFAVMKAMGFSINTLTLFGITLATGLVVDDAIVVIENIARLMEEKKISAIAAAREGMKEVTGAVIATALVLAAVFIPVAFFPGTTGQLYRQFALTLAISVGISAFNALTLTPALAALLLKHEHGNSNWFFAKINWFLDSLRDFFESTLGFLLKFKPVVVVGFIASLALTAFLYTKIPTGFLPDEDVGYFMIIVQGPDGVSLDYTSNVVAKVEKVVSTIPAISGVFAVGGFSFSGNNSSNAIVFCTLKPWNERHKEADSANGIIASLRGPLFMIDEAFCIPFNPPPIQGLGNFGGFAFELENTQRLPLEEFSKISDGFLAEARKSPLLTGIQTTFRMNSPQLIIDVDRDKAESLGINVGDIFNTLQVFIGSLYVNDFDYLDRSYRTYLQADSQFRSNPKDIDQLYVRAPGGANGTSGAMIPISNFITKKNTTSPPTISHYNMFKSIEVNGAPAPGISSGQAIAEMEAIAKRTLPRGTSFEWTGISLEEIQSGNLAILIFALGLLFVFLVLAAQYESLMDPLIILFAVPLAVLGAIGAQMMRGLQNDIFCQIGLVMLIGLASKNSILIVEFANQLHAKGLSYHKAIVDAALTRLRPILMTSLAFIFGILPLAIAEGAGANGRHSLGTTVMGGMIVSTILSLYVVPVLYLVFKSIKGIFIKEPKLTAPPDDDEPHGKECGELPGTKLS